MASQLSDIITAIAGMTVTVASSTAYNGDKTPTALYLSTLPQNAPDAKLPCRLVEKFNAGSADNARIEFGNTTIMRVPWRITDKLLWRPLAQGLGVGSHEADLVKYCAAYVEAIKKIIAPTSRSFIVNISPPSSEEINYPLGSQYYYAGVVVTIDIEERLIDDNSVSNWA